jgi:hypothetical protein
MCNLVNNENFDFCGHTYLCVLFNSYNKVTVSLWFYDVSSPLRNKLNFYLNTTQIQFNNGIFNGTFFITAKLKWTSTHCCREQWTSTATHGLEWCMQQIFYENHPEELTPSPRMVRILVVRLKGTGSVADRPHTGQKRRIWNEEVSVNILTKNF